MERLRRKKVGKRRTRAGEMTEGNGEKAGGEAGDEEETGRKGLRET